MSVADKLKKWAANPDTRAVQHLTIDEVDDLAAWAIRELAPTGRFGMTRSQQELDSANQRVGSRDAEIRMLKVALDNRDITIAQLKEKLK